MPTLRIGVTADRRRWTLPIAIDAHLADSEDHGDKGEDAEKEKENHGRNATDC